MPDARMPDVAASPGLGGAARRGNVLVQPSSTESGVTVVATTVQASSFKDIADSLFEIL
jgi:hypothetical protein